MKAIIISLLLVTIFSSSTNAQTSIPPEADKLYSNFTTQINPKHIAWMKTAAKTMNDKKLPESDAKVLASKYAATAGITNNMDIEALTFLVLMQAAKSAQEDLKSIMTSVKEVNKKKEDLRRAHETMKNKGTAISSVQLDSFKLLLSNKQTIQKINTTPAKQPARLDAPPTIKTNTAPTRQVTKAELDETTDKVKKDLDSMSEMGEMESLRLQMAMDRMSKMMSTLSNLLKKISDSASSITQNLK